MKNEKSLSTEQILSSFKKISDDLEAGKFSEDSREYEVSVVGFVKSYDGPEESYINSLKSILKDKLQEGNKPVAYMAFYCIATYHRRHANTSLYAEILTQYKEEFSKYNSLKFLELMYDKMAGKKHFERILFDASALCAIMKDNIGVLHCFAETVAEICEKEQQHMPRIARDWMEQAMQYIEDAIYKDNTYAKFYCTKGRLLAIKALVSNHEEERVRNYQEAIEYVKNAIDLEKSSSSDYVLRIGNYQHYINMIQSEVYKDSLTRQMAEIQDKLDSKINKINIQNLEFLGFFVALVSFTLGSINIIKENSFETSATLILVLMGALLVAFSGLGFILHGFENKLKPNLMVMVVGAVIIIGSLAYGAYI